MITAVIAGLNFNGTIGAGAILTLVGVTAACVTLFWKLRQGDPSEWRENYLAEVEKSRLAQKEAAEQRELKHQALVELAAARMKTDLTGLMKALVDQSAASAARIDRLEERFTKRLDAFDTNQQKQTEILTGLVEAMRTANAVAA